MINMKTNIKFIDVKFMKVRLEIGTSTWVEFYNYLINSDLASSLDCTFNFL